MMPLYSFDLVPFANESTAAGFIAGADALLKLAADYLRDNHPSTAADWALIQAVEMAIHDVEGALAWSRRVAEERGQTVSP